LLLAALLALAFSTPALAFDGRGGDRVVIASEEVVNDDLYVGAQQFILEGTVHGDVVAFGQTVTINGTVDGDLITAAQTVIVSGEVTGSIRMAGSVLFVADTARIDGDVVGAGYSLEVRPGNAIGRDLVFAGQQLLLAGDVIRNVKVAAAAFELQGKVGGDVVAEVADASQANTMIPPAVFMPPSTVAVPGIQAGLTVAPSASIGGDLTYTQWRDLSIPAGVVLGRVARTAPSTPQTAVREATYSERVASWTAGIVRHSLTLIVISSQPSCAA
jgi:cytoskeletal protein CcmA (bactofilin family)